MTTPTPTPAPDFRALHDAELAAAHYDLAHDLDGDDAAFAALAATAAEDSHG